MVCDRDIYETRWALPTIFLLEGVSKEGLLSILRASMTSLKLQGRLSSAYRFRSTAIDHNLRHAQLPIKSIRKFPIILVNLQEEDDPESNSWKIYAFYDTLNAVNRTLAMNPHEGSVYNQPDKSGSGSLEVPKLTPSNGHCLPELSENHLANLFEKLKAVHLHLLAAEHWNACHLKLCHRYHV